MFALASNTKYTNSTQLGRRWHVHLLVLGVSELLSFSGSAWALDAELGAQVEDEQQGSSQRTQDAPRQRKQGATALEEIIVTAQRHAERLQDVPISISVLNGQELDRSSDRGAYDALSKVPGVTIDASAGSGGTAGGTQLGVRGVSAPSSYIAGSSPVGYYLDTVPFSLVRSALVPDANVYDLERVEALRGPQGTLYGVNAQAGVVRILTKDASLDELEFKARASVSHIEIGGESSRIDAALNVPIIEGKLAARAVVGYQDVGGWIDKPTRRDANDGTVKSARVKLNAQPSEQLSVGLSAWASRSEYGASAFSDVNDRERYFIADVEPYSQDFDTYGLKIGYDFREFSLTSATSYLDFYSENHVNQAVVSGVTQSFAETALPAKAFAQEINLVSTNEGPWRWNAGAIYRDGRDRIKLTVANIIFPGSLRYDSQSWAVYGELTRRLIDGKFEITAGLRYFEDRVSLHEEQSVGNVQPAQHVSVERTFHATTPRFVVAWHPNEQMTVYSSYSEGFRSGVHQTPAVIAQVPSIKPAEPDLLKNYEAGVKGSLLHGMISYEVAGYYMDWQDVQLPLIVFIDNLGRGALVNGAAASGPGVDVALAVQPLNGLQFGMSYSWNDLTLDKDVYSNNVLLYEKGSRLSQSIETTASAFLDYGVPVGSSGIEASFAASINMTSAKEETSLRGATSVTLGGDQIAFGRVSFSLDSQAGWSASIFVDNVTDEKSVVTRSVVQGSLGTPNAVWLTPRTIGLQLEYRL